MVPGYNGKILRVNLTKGTTTVEELDELFCRKYIGGAGFVSYYLLKELKAGVDPLGPENILIWACGPATGIPLSGNSRYCVGTKSPLTGGYAKSECGGFWAAEFRRAGYDAIIVEGKASKPVYLWIQDGVASIRDASQLWGKLAKETEEAIRKELGDEHIKVSLIGPGGENMVRFACVMSDLKDAAGRGGTGAVMGSKNLKAIAVRGHHLPAIANPDKVKGLREWLSGHRELWASFNELGTGAAMEATMKTGNIPIHNFLDGEFSDMGKISAEALRDTIRVKMDACFGCIVRCKKVNKVDEPYNVDPDYGGPEYETLGALGSTCDVGDLKAIAKANELCGAYTLDTISAGVTIAFAMECFENGLLTTRDTDGFELKFGDGAAMIKAVEMIAKREGIGDLLAEGTARAAQRIGKGAEKYAMNVKGLEIPMHEPRVKAALGLGYAVNPHGADHCANLHDTMFSQAGPGFDRLMKPLGYLEPLPADDLSPRKVAMFRDMHFFRLMTDNMVTCMFVPFDPQQQADIMNAVTGWNISFHEMMKVAERTLTMARMFNIREGFTAKDDTLPDRFFQPKRNGVLMKTNYTRAKLNKAVQYYYSLMGWDSKGVPTPEKIQELAIDVG
jgi:aldehyde:ferredoxin oxidoreductase